MLLPHPEPDTPKFANGPAADERAGIQRVEQKKNNISKSKSAFAKQAEQEAIQQDYRSDSEEENMSISAPNSPNGELSLNMSLQEKKSKPKPDEKEANCALSIVEEKEKEEEVKGDPKMNDSNGSEPKIDNIGGSQKKLDFLKPKESQPKMEESMKSLLSRHSRNSSKNQSGQDIGD